MRRRKSALKGLMAVLFSLLFVNQVSAQQWGGYGGWHTGPGMMGGWGMGWFGSIFMLIFWGLVIVGLILVIRWLLQASHKDTGPAQSGSRALDILKERYARGEIDRQEFEQKKKDLME